MNLEIGYLTISILILNTEHDQVKCKSADYASCPCTSTISLPGAGAASVVLVGLEALAGSMPSAAAPPSVPGALRISLEVSEDMPVTAQPAQPEDAPAG